MGVGNLLGTWWYWWRRILKDVFSSCCVIKTCCMHILYVLLPEGEGFHFCSTGLCHFSDASGRMSGRMSGPVLRQGQYLLMLTGFTRTNAALAQILTGLNACQCCFPFIQIWHLMHSKTCWQIT